jgi:hypothetical protein
MDVTNKSRCNWFGKNEIDFALVSVPASLNIEKLDLLQNKLFFGCQPN